jgi:alpha-mannosidase
MSAWVMGEIKRVDALKPFNRTVERQGDRVLVRYVYNLQPHNALSRASFIMQTFTVTNSSDQIDCEVQCDWGVVGTPAQPNPTLRVAVDVAAQNPVARHEIPFGWITRPTNGVEFPALQWADVSDSTGGVALLNDSKHGYSVAGGTMRLTLIRSSFDPDPEPNPGQQVWHYAILPHEASLAPSEIARRAAEFNQPLLTSLVPYDADGKAPNTFGFIAEPAHGVVPTVLKRAEDRDGWVLRAYEADGRPSTGALTPQINLGPATWVNFLEDKLGDARLDAGKLPLQLHRFEIRTVKFKNAQ